MNYAQLAFTDAIKKIQERIGSRNSYDRMERTSYVDGLTEYETEFIASQDSFYIASYGENEFPYVNFRGGPPGFVKVLDDKTIGIVDFIGNRQYISVGNISKNPKVALIMVCYPRRARLKIYAEPEVIEIKDDPELFDRLKPEDYKFKPGQMMVFRIAAYDWNCPQHITPKFTAAEIEEALVPQREYIADLEEQVRVLKEQLSKR